MLIVDNNLYELTAENLLTALDIIVEVTLDRLYDNDTVYRYTMSNPGTYLDAIEADRADGVLKLAENVPLPVRVGRIEDPEVGIGVVIAEAPSGGSGEPVEPMALRAERSKSPPGSMPAFMHAVR
jgi:hypothetical protein